jgi:uncharacterized membrane protein YeaQ/YmgE (transglycosylase-associated protein family)
VGFLTWIVVGLIAGWLAGHVMKGGGYGVVMDIILGILVALWVDGSSACWASTAPALLGRSSLRLSAR